MKTFYEAGVAILDCDADYSIDSKRIEKQITEIQEKSDNKRGEVCCLHFFSQAFLGPWLTSINRSFSYSRNCSNHSPVELP